MFTKSVIRLYEVKDKYKDDESLVAEIDKVLGDLLVGMAMTTDIIAECVSEKRIQH